MPYLIDTYNLIHQCHLLPTEQTIQTALQLAELLDELLPDEQIRLICDGAPVGNLPERYTFNNMEIRFAGGGRDADSLMEWILQTDHATRNLTVISSDRRLIKAAKRAKAHHMTSDSFASQLARQMGSQSMPSQKATSDASWDDLNTTMTELSHDMDLSDLELPDLGDVETESKPGSASTEPKHTPPQKPKPSTTTSAPAASAQQDEPAWLKDFDPDDIDLDALASQLPAHLQDQMKAMDQQTQKQKQLSEKKKAIQEDKAKIVEKPATVNPLIDEFTKDLPVDDRKTLSEETDTDRWLKDMGIDPNRLIDEHGS